MRRDARRTLAAALGALLLLPTGSGCVVTTLILGTEKRKVYEFEGPLKVSDPEFRRSAEALGNPVVGGNAVTLLENGDEIFPAMIRDMLAAKKTINLETYIFQPDRAGRLVGDALIAAARNGVEVRLLVDAWGSKFEDLGKEFEAAGIHAKKYRPLRLFAINKVGRRTHRKILIVDGRIAYTGGLGIDEHWFGNARNTKEWRETQVRAEGPVAAQMQAIFSEDWTFTTGEILVGEKFYPTLPVKGGTLGQAIKASRGDSTSLAKMMYYIAIESASKSIYIENAYFVPDSQMREALIQAVRRGVDVQVIVPGRHIDLPMVRFASWRHYSELLQGGVRIWEYEPTMIHNKTMVVDGIYSTVGSINFDARSMNSNAEESLAFYDRDFGKKMEAMFYQDRRRCEEITDAQWRHRGLEKRLSETVFWAFEPYY
ncbi:MAG TPA: phospholipase D-like domain-containing protein [Thermoanaerobaculia bacterium]|nr:phospholipase D-like domain-containing protein [Thermoanaerobaculia bacterium]